ncbi:MAG: translation initiation factor IF-2 [Candidatus Omnitrophica bacterium]|nr:translation initiation factor IF-2 [Candidatus Omnitrophota bacterium]
MKVRDLAKELEVKNEDVLESLRKLYVDVEDEFSAVPDKIAGLIRVKLGGSISAKKAARPKKLKKKAEKTPKDALPKKDKKKIVKKVSVKDEKKSAKLPKTKSEPKAADKKVPEPKVKKTDKKKIKEKESPLSKIRIVERAKVRGKPEGKGQEKDFDKEDRKLFKKGSKPVKGKKGKKGKSKPVIEVVEKVSISKTKYRKRGREQRGRGVSSRFATTAKPPSERKTAQKVEVNLPISVKALAPHINTKPNLIIQYFVDKGKFVNINQELEEVDAREVMEHFGYKLALAKTIESIEKELVGEHHHHAKKSVGESRAPIVTFMGHVDHGKTSLLDYIRKTMVTKGEKGGITQHIGAYKVETPKGAVTFLDTPGHAAFTAMRARGAHATDVVVLVVAADDGVMPQTKEAIDHARAAGVSIVVAINKCDLPGANPDAVKKALQEENLVAEDWGGETIMAEVSAETGDGVDHLVEMLMLESEMLELKANPKLKARGVVIEGKKTPGQGVVATLLVQNGTLHVGDIVLCGIFYGKVKAMMNDRRERIKSALPTTPVEVLGLEGLPESGEEFFVVKDEKKAKTLAELKQNESRHQNMTGSKRVTLEDLHSYIAAGNIKELTVILKADVQGSVEALKHSLKELETDEVKINIIHSAAGNINESDVMLAMVSNAVVIGFNVKVDLQAESLAKSEKIDVRVYDIIYEAIADVKAGMEGLLEPEEVEVVQGSAQIREIFSAKTGKAAGCAVIKGVIHRKDRIKIKRGKEIVHVGDIASLKRFKDDVREVKEGFEFGISIKGFNAIRKNDIIEAFIIEKIARRLEK